MNAEENILTVISYDSTDPESLEKAHETKTSIEKYDGWSPFLLPLITKENLPRSIKWADNGKMSSHIEKVEKDPENLELYRDLVYYQREAISQRLFWQRVASRKKACAFIEAGMMCYSDWSRPKFSNCLILHMQHAFDFPSPLERYWMHIPKEREIGVHPIDPTHPLEYSFNNRYSGSKFMPGTNAYVMNPQGANQMIKGTSKYGLDQAGQILNTALVDLEFLYPSAFRFKTADLITDGTRLP